MCIPDDFTEVFVTGPFADDVQVMYNLMTDDDGDGISADLVDGTVQVRHQRFCRSENLINVVDALVRTGDGLVVRQPYRLV